MKKTDFQASPQWRAINNSSMALEKFSDFKNFKSNKVNFKIALWDPRFKGVRYLKVLIYNLCASLSDKQLNKIAKIKNRNVGNPISITYNGQDVDLDYLRALYELEMIERHVKLRGTDMLEIGAGYGRTCHALLSNHDVKSYHIVDLDNSIQLSRKYLKTVLDKKNFSKIQFIKVDNMDNLNEKYFDLCINIDSFAEMKPEVVRNYLDFISRRCSYVYLQNPVGKYVDKSLDSHSQGKKTVNLALASGILRDVIDIDDNLAVIKQAKKFVKVYLPGEGWSIIEDQWVRPWSFYWHVLYRAPIPR